MMLKFLFWILLLGNAGLLAYQQGYFDALLPSGREPARMKQQLNADKLRLVPPPDPNQPPPAPPAAEQAPASPAEPAAPAMPAAPVTPVTPPAPPAPTAPAAPAAVAPVSTSAAATPKKKDIIACTEIGGFNPEDAKRFAAQLAPLALGDRVSQRPLQEVANHMVYIPPQADREGAEKKAGELRKLGIEDFFIIQDNSPLRWGISLGVFKHEEAARAHLAALGQKGVRTARIGQRTVTSSQVAFRLRDIDAETKSALDKIRTGFPKQEVRACEGA
ncbi:MAG TPA: SPOR domain-containing protein [Noviherbaspirillum sp.]|uniref:SPOR domain-containing protein n=1 Tax=Noviherbaspirillum sp. TaxID=1926288 RepID=UPI002D5C3A97|nr:SPOR domain-containing protein [Noviherbaspirillum sp.]HYD97458.1 SPOR domain-containing protein [Noviherbaspirillum sp.]